MALRVRVLSCAATSCLTQACAGSAGFAFVEFLIAAFEGLGAKKLGSSTSATCRLQQRACLTLSQAVGSRYFSGPAPGEPSLSTPIAVAGSRASCS